MIHSLFNTNDQNKDSNIQFPKENLTNMRKGTMINGSEVYYGKGRKIDVKQKNMKKNNGNIQKINKIRTNNNFNQIKHYEQISYKGEEQKRANNLINHEKQDIKEKSKKLCIDKEFDFNFDESQPSCFISIRLYKGDIIKGQFNNNQKLKDVYSFVKRFSHNSFFILLEGFPPKPLIEYEKTIDELGLENSVLTQRIN